eukprot:CAMPEP_0117459424 /NCGR_PEP_ID=MMETSP0784-20121206/1469_1 /TAXON_ID=39447 /ORGANISM="" /LENGTH=66 /DNA_ID=CAMNT_0005253033 /DNA_START=883 /DNA_END=1083 /DNA_ORIENTATION=+
MVQAAPIFGAVASTRLNAIFSAATITKVGASAGTIGVSAWAMHNWVWVRPFLGVVDGEVALSQAFL